MELFKKDRRTLLEREIDSVIEQMSVYTPYSDEYMKMAANLEVLRKAEANKPKPIIPVEPIVVGIFTLVSTAMVLHFEKADVITSKAFNWIIKGRV